MGHRMGDGGALRRSIEVFEGNGQPAARMEHGTLLKTGSVFNSVNVFQDGERKIELGIDPDDDQLGMSIQESDDEPLLILGKIGDAVGIAVHDPNTHGRGVAMGVDASDGNRGFNVFGTNENNLASMGANVNDPSGGRVNLFNAAGVPTFSAP